MMTTVRTCLLMTAFLLMLSSAATTSFAGPVISYDPELGLVTIVRKSDVNGEVASKLVVESKGRLAVSKLNGTLTGVLFQATAVPDDSLKSVPIKLSYRLRHPHDATLCAKIGTNQVVSDVPAWIWTVAAKFADHRATAAVTLADNPRTTGEKEFARRWRAKNKSAERLLWSKCHPAVDDTLVGFFLLMADAMIGDPNHVKSVTNGLQGFDKYGGYSQRFDQVKSAQAARTLDALISLEAKTGDCAMLNDVDEMFQFRIVGDELRVSGVPNYHFARATPTGRFQEIKTLTRNCRQNRRLFMDVNPIVYKTIDDFAKLVAFFNYIDQTDPAELDAFIGSLEPVLVRIPTIDAPIALTLPAR